MKNLAEALRRRLAPAALAALLAAAPALAAVTKTELAGNDLAAYPFFEYVHAINAGSPLHVAIDPSRFPAIGGQVCDIYVVAAKKTAGWIANNTLTDVTAGGMMTVTFTAGPIQSNTFLVAGPFELSAAAGNGLGVGYDVVLDCNQNGLLDGNDYIDNPNNEAGFYMVHDTTAPGPYAVIEPAVYQVPNSASFGIPTPGFEWENVFFPATWQAPPYDKVPLIVISHGNGHNYQWYDHIGNHLASYGYIVMSHQNNTGPGPVTASTTTLGHTDAFIAAALAGTIPNAAILATHLDPTKIVWIGHSRGGEGVAIAYDRLFDNTYFPVNYLKSNIKLISSMLPTDFNGTAVANPHDANYHLWTASGDADVSGAAGSVDLQTFHLHDRATGHRQSTTVQGTGHGWFHNGGGNPWFTGPCSIGQADTHAIELGHFLPLIKRYVEHNIPSIDFLTRQYESFRPLGAPNGVCDVVTHEYYDASVNGTVVIDDYQTQLGANTSSIGAAVTYNVDNLTEDRLDDNNSNFAWNAADPFNGATQAAIGGVYNDTSRGVVFDWTNADKYYEWAIPAAEQDFTDNLWLSFRGAQGTQHPNTLALAGDLTFSVTLRDAANVSSSINIGAYGGGIETPYLRSSGWHNEMESIRIRLTDFLNNYSGLDLSQIVAVRLDVGPSWGSSRGRLVIDDLVLSNDRAVYFGADNGDPHITTVSGENYDFQSAGEFTLLRDDDEVEIQARQTPVSSAPAIYNAHTQLASCVSVNTAVAVRVAGRRVTYQPSLNGEASPDGMELRVDGELIDIDAALVVPLGPDAQVAKSGVGVGIRIDFPDGGWLTAIPGWWGWQNTWYLNIDVRNTPASEGVMGVIPNGGWLPRLPDGSSMGPRPLAEPQRFSDLNVKFANAWRVDNATSLFDYAPGMSTADFTDKNFPPHSGERCDIPGHPPIKPIAFEVAAELCRPILKKTNRDNCIFDVAQTGERNFVRTYQLIEMLDKREEPPVKP